MMNRGKEKLLRIIDEIVRQNILTSGDLKKKILPILMKNNDSRKVSGLASRLLEGNADEIKESDIAILIKDLENLVDLVETNPVEEIVDSSTNEQQTENDNNKIIELYNESLITIKNLENKLEEVRLIEDKCARLELQVKKFNNLNIDQILAENKMYSEMFKITGTRIIEIPDEDIDALYIRYKTQGIKTYGKAFITENELMPKSYYDIKGR